MLKKKKITTDKIFQIQTAINGLKFNPSQRVQGLINFLDKKMAGNSFTFLHWASTKEKAMKIAMISICLLMAAVNAQIRNGPLPQTVR